jgi:hypothetical protein
MNVVGIGTQDDVKAAQAFVARAKIKSVRMYWDPTFDAWDYFGVAGQPAAVLMDKTGKPIKQYSGFLDTKKVLAEVKKIK